MTTALAAIAELPRGSGEKFRTGTYYQYWCSRGWRGRGCHEASWLVTRPRRPNRTVQPWIPVDHLTRNPASAAYRPPPLPLGIIGGLALPRQAQSHAPRLLPFAQRVVILEPRIEVIIIRLIDNWIRSINNVCNAFSLIFWGEGDFENKIKINARRVYRCSTTSP